VSTDDADISSASLVQVVGDTASSPVGATLVATDRTARAFEPIQLLIVTDGIFLIVSFVAFEFVLDE
jgi:hypothetical protein